MLLAAGLGLFALLFVRALRTFRLTQRLTDLLVAVGIVWLGRARPALCSTTRTSAGGSVTASSWSGSRSSGSRRVRPLPRLWLSRPLVGDLRAVELVTQEEAFLGSHVRALLVSLAEKDASTEEHTRRVALRAVEVGEELGLPAVAFAASPSAACSTTWASSPFPARCCKLGPLTDVEFDLVSATLRRAAAPA